ncbi:MAG: hypothetical protein ABH885_07165 [Candidatus Omnitrophota bacterium]
MRRRSILATVKKLGKAVFTTHEIAMMSGKSVSAVTQSLNNLVRDGIIIKLYKGIWAQADAALSPYEIIQYLFKRERAYVSFVSALNMHGIIEQIPQVTTLASTVHTRTIRTAAGIFRVHRISPLFFDGFGWYKENGGFLIAEPEKALVDCLYLSACKKKNFGHFPELHFPDSFSFNKVKSWINKIPRRNIRIHVKKQWERLNSRHPVRRLSK